MRRPPYGINNSKHGSLPYFCVKSLTRDPLRGRSGRGTATINNRFFSTLYAMRIRGHLCFPIPATSVFFREVHAVAPLFQFLSPFLGFLFPRPLLLFLFLSSRPSCGVGRCVQLFRPSYQTFAPFGVKGEEEETEEEEGLPSLLSHSERDPPFPHRRHLHHFMASDFWVFLSPALFLVGGGGKEML